MYSSGTELFRSLERELHRNRKPNERYLPGQRRKVANNTYAYATRWGAEGEVAQVGICLHHTTVLHVDDTGTITLNSGGWQTVTTRDRINRYLPSPVRVFSQKSEFSVSLDGWNKTFERTAEFVDGMRLWQDGNGRWQASTALTSAPENVQARKLARRWAREARQLPWLIGSPCTECAEHPTLSHIAHAHARRWDRSGYDPELVRKALREKGITAPASILDPAEVSRALIHHVDSLEMA